MMRSLFAGVSGLKNHQVRMDVIGNNIANVNTLGFKAGRVTFKEGFAQMLQGAGAPQDGQGGTNPMQVGLGMRIGSMDTIFTQGNLETTGVNTDLAVQGDAFFVVKKGGQSFYTRAGNFTLDSDGRLVSATNGYAVQGRMATNGVFASDVVGDIRLPVGQKAPAAATSETVLGGNLNAQAEIGTQVNTSITVYDSQGGAHEIGLVLEKTAANTWSITPDTDPLPEGVASITLTGDGNLTFNADGTLTERDNPTITVTPTGGEFEDIEFTLNLGSGSLNGITQFAGSTTAALQGQDGYSWGTMQSFSIDRTGTITGAFSNGITMALGQVVLADFNNPGGLMRNGENMYSTSSNSGEAVMNFASETSPSSIASGALEMSNVDLTQEFTNMIVAQRGFQANSKVITSTDEMLQEIVNLKR
jgi:flagellar hook protein FlgE